MVMSEGPKVRRVGEESAYYFAFEGVRRGRAWGRLPWIGGNETEVEEGRISVEGMNGREGRTQGILRPSNPSRPSRMRPGSLQCRT